MLAGLAIAIASDWTLVMTIVLVPVLHFGVVKREERYLEAKFGDAYRNYKAQVPRYGWPSARSRPFRLCPFMKATSYRGRRFRRE